MSKQTLIDSSFLYAMYAPNDKKHAKANAFSETATTIPVVPEIVLPEVTFLFLRDSGHHAVVRFLEKFASTQTELIHLLHGDLQRA